MAPTSPVDARYRNGNALRMSGDVEAAEAEFRRALASDPGHRDAAYSLAFMLREQGRTGAAAQVIGDWWKQAAPSADAALAAIGFVIECADYPCADAMAFDAHRRWPADARLSARAGEIALALGAFDKAADLLRDALDRDASLSTAWLRLAYCKRFDSAADADVLRLRRGWENSALDRTARTCAGFALGKALDDLGDYAQAVEVLRPANAQARAAANWDAQDWQRLLDARTRLPTLAADSGFVPIFIVGLPRTGTTMIAGSLARHADVRDRGELNWIGAMFEHLREHGRFGDANALAAVADLIRRQMRRDDAPARFYIDKNPLNFRYLDLVAALFPQTQVVYCTRNARDTALSLWMQRFAHEDLGFAYAFETIAAAQKLCAALMRRWQEELPIGIVRIEYERFVADSQGAQSRLAAQLGIGSQARADASAEAITTASVWQARQPVYSRSVGRWQRYAPFLPELAALFPD